MRIGIYQIKNGMVLLHGCGIDAADHPICRADDPEQAARLLDVAYRRNNVKDGGRAATALIREAEAKRAGEIQGFEEE